MLGTALREALTERNLSFLQLVRSAPRATDQLQWDASGTTIPHSEGIEDLDAAIHLSGANVAAHRWTPEYKREIIDSRVNSTRALATALAGLRYPPKVLLVASATGIYGDRGDELIDETSPLGTGFLAETCRQWEAAAKPASDAGIRVLYLRFGVVLGPEGALARLLPIFRLGLGGQLGNGRQYMSWISLPDALAAILFLLETPTLSGPINLADHLHRPAFLGVPAFALRLALGEMADEALLSGARAYPAKLAKAGFKFSHTSLIHALPAVLG
jgi:hypothetical protein